MYQALGLVPEGTDLLAVSNDMNDSGSLAFYDPVTERVTVRGTEMTTGLAVTLVHELVHVAQDQAFDLERSPPGDSAGAFEGYDALIEGDAIRVDPLVALSAADGWGGDAYTGYRLGEGVCVRLDLVGDTPEHTAEIASALEEWADHVRGATVDDGGEQVAVDRCAGSIGRVAADPAAVGAYDALTLPATRAQIMAATAAEGQSHGEAFAVGDCFVRRVPLDTILAVNESGDRSQEVLDAVEACGGTP